jgi:hypothetical protein
VRRGKEGDDNDKGEEKSEREMKRERRKRSRLCVALNLGVTAGFDSGPPKNVLGTALHHSVGGGVQILGKALHILQISGSRWILGVGNSGDKGEVGHHGGDFLLLR